MVIWSNIPPRPYSKYFRRLLYHAGLQVLPEVWIFSWYHPFQRLITALNSYMHQHPSRMYLQVALEILSSEVPRCFGC